MNPHMPTSELSYFKQILHQAKHYLEIGCGGSTHMANGLVKSTVFSIESDTHWIRQVQIRLPVQHKVTFHHVDTETLSETWGYPGPKCSDDKKREYSRSILKYPHGIPNVILIDGRFRVACALHAHSIIDENTIVLFDDFYNRLPDYQQILEYYDVKKRVGNMAHLCKKLVSIPPEIILKYELDPR
jgi:hypothetical protein